MVDTTLHQSVEIDGTQYAVSQGKGIYMFKVAQNPVKSRKTGNVSMESPFDNSFHKYPFKLEYEVLEKK